ncbi:hypothetical protein GQ43DRAFT_220833 [Delitschia confertaspora ATCC 74209]|uniref:Uncharacterized protein n=1 Tax=Delitschia confertaspora ATCC 74209 TaxID=1513339 RepID=A0A9P4JQP8_9PLEO|nr:hypothetical protein GQ43DRAFT_220833 [Delitschia confertaspora ATCC 74209]
MSTPASRRPDRGQSRSPPPSIARNVSTPVSFSQDPSPITPKSEYLRTALLERRVKGYTPAATPEPSTSSPKEPVARRRSTVPTLSVTSSMESVATDSTVSTYDPWLDNAALERSDSERTSTWQHHRTPSGAGLTRRPTQRGVESKQDKLKQNNFDIALKLGLVQEQNTKLKNALEEARKRIQQLEPLQGKVKDLREENDLLQLKIRDMEEVFELFEDKYGALKDAYAELKAKNKEFLAINQEMIEELEKRDAGLNEAADLLFQFEQENTALKASLSAIRPHATDPFYYGADAGIDTPTRRPRHVTSNDGSRKSTSIADSDYYSQQESPPVCPEVDLKRQSLGVHSERVQSLVDRTLESRNSVHSLRNRLSQVSFGTGTERSETPPHPMPEIPESTGRAERGNRTHAVPKRNSNGRLIITPDMRDPLAPRNKPSVDGLRGLYESGKPISSKSRPPPTLDFKSRAEAMGKVLPEVDLDPRPYVDSPPYLSSRSTTTDHSSTSYQRANPSKETLVSENESTWDNPAHLPVVSDDDLTPESDADNKWWKDVGKLPERRSHFPPTSPSTVVPTEELSAPTLARSHQSRPADISLGHDMFNGAVTEEEFMERARQQFPPRRR